MDIVCTGPTSGSGNDHGSSGTSSAVRSVWVTNGRGRMTRFLRNTLPSRTPFAGKNFNVTRAGIHADGLLKNEEIYNIFDTEKFLKRPALVSISNTSGLAGIAHWINSYYRLPQERHLDKNSELVHKLKDWVDEQYDEGRVTVLTDNELVVKITECCKELGIIL